MRERIVDLFQRHDDDGDAKVTPAEFNRRFARIVARLDDDDLVTRRELREQRRARLRHRPGRRGG